MTLICTVYRSPKREGMYLYVNKEDGLEQVPAALMQSFGEPQQVMTLVLTAERKLARVERDEVEQKIREQGFFLQMPPGNETLFRRKTSPDN